MASSTATVGVEVCLDPAADAAELDELTAKLRRQLSQLDVESVRRASAGAPPPGTRAADVTAVGSLIVTLSQTPELLAAVFGAVGSWLRGRRDRTVKLEMDGDVIEVSGISSEQQDELIDAWVSRHTNR